MKLAGTIYTTNKKSFVVQCLFRILHYVCRTKGLLVGGIQVVTIKLDQAPTVTEVRNGIEYQDIDWGWLIKNYPANGNFSCLHISRKDRERIGLTHSNGKSDLGGRYNRNIGDSSMEFIVIADKSTDFVRIFLHELSHGFSHWTGVKDITHYFEDTGKFIGEIYMSYDFTKWNVLKAKAESLTTERDKLLLNKK